MLNVNIQMPTAKTALKTPRIFRKEKDLNPDRGHDIIFLTFTQAA
jgi:hypothetical protein